MSEVPLIAITFSWYLVGMLLKKNYCVGWFFKGQGHFMQIHVAKKSGTYIVSKLLYICSTSHLTWMSNYILSIQYFHIYKFCFHLLVCNMFIVRSISHLYWIVTVSGSEPEPGYSMWCSLHIPSIYTGPEGVHECCAIGKSDVKENVFDLRYIYTCIPQMHW